MDTSKIIKGAVSNGRYTVTAPIVKEDYGLYLKIEGVELPETYQVDFSNSENSGTSVTMIGNADGVLIPRQFIDSGKDVFAFLYHVGEDFGRTVYKFRIPNKVRPDRTNEQPTPEEQSTIDQAISALNEAVAQTAQDVIDADASAQASAESAQDSASSALSASDSAERASASATSASQSASQASASASASANSASQSAQIKSDVENLADDAQGYAESASQSATASANSATTAQGYAQSASSSAQSASGYASQAQTSAQTASAKAQDASGYAQTASGKASESAQSASQALGYKTDAESAKTASQTAQGLAESARDSAISAKTDAEQAKADAESARDEAVQAVASISGALDDKADVITDTASGAVASFTDGADNLPLKSLIVDINPIQDLHGQESPYPAGGGANKFDGLWNGETTAYNTAVNLIPVTPSETYYVYAPNIASSERVFGVFYDADGQALGTRVNLGRNTTFTVPADAVSLRLNVWNTLDVTNIAINYPSTVTTYSPYENICPISGWTQVGVGQSGKNLFDKTAITANSWIVVNSTDIAIAAGYFVSDYIPVIKNVSIVGTARGASRCCYYDKQKNPIAYFSWSSGKLTPLYDGYIRVTDINGNLDTLQIEYGSTTPSYSPYTGRSITIDLGQTVYGGHIDVISGVMVISEIYDKHKWSEYANATVLGDTERRSLTIMQLSKYPNYSVTPICSVAPYQTSFASDSIHFYVNSQSPDRSNVIVFLPVGTDEDLEIEICFELAEVIEIQLSANQINSLYGVNNIWADSGDTTAEYRADTKLYIERLTAPDSADMIADANITSGKYFMVGNSLYKATANIANGAQIIVGTNCTRVSLAQALNEINA